MGGKMSKFSLSSLLVLVFLVSFGFSGAALGDSAMVLPKGVSAVNAVYYHYSDIDERYDPDGNVEDIATDYNVNLNSSVFPALAPLEASNGGPLPDGTATLGQSFVDFTLKYNWWEIAYARGLSDRVTLGILIPYNNSENDVNALVDSSAASVGVIPFAPYLAPSTNIGGPGTPLTTDQVRDLLGAGLDADGDGSADIPGYGYDSFGSWSGSGIGDIELLAKYKLYDEDDWRLALTGGVRLPTGEVDDPDNLTDVGFGDGTTDLILRFHTDYVGINKLFLNATLRYDIQLPDEETKRVPDDVNLPLTANKEKVDRNLGDILELELLGNYSLTREWSMGLKYRYTAKQKDEVDGDMGFAYSSLEDETDFTSHMGFLLVGYSTVRKYMDENTGIPFDLNLSYRDRFAGTNNVTVSQYISVDFSLYF